MLDPAQSPQEYEQDDRSVREHRKEHGRKVVTDVLCNRPHPYMPFFLFLFFPQRKLNHKESNGR